MGMIKDFRRLFGLFSKREKRNSAIMLGLIGIGGVLAIMGIGAILPFTMILLDQEAVYRYPILQTITEVPWIGGHRRFVVLMSIAFVLVFLIKSLYMFFLIYIQNRFARNMQVGMSKKLYQCYIYKPYEFFFQKSTVELSRNIGLVTSVIQGMLMTGITFLNELITIAFIVALLFIVDPITSISIVVVLGGVVIAAYALLKSKLEETTKKQNELAIVKGRLIREGLAGIKAIKMIGSERSFVIRYHLVSMTTAKLAAFYNLASQAPRLLIEMIAMSGIVIIVLVNALRTPDMTEILPMLALFGFAAMRVMPSMARITSHLTTIRVNTVHFNQIYEDLRAAVDLQESELIKIEKINFDANIEVRNLSYTYPGTDKVILENINLTIPKGQSVGVKGVSGGGKTTLIDILLGLLEPKKGEVLVDGVDISENLPGWRKNIGYVPQSIFIIDDSVAANVALGIPKEEIDMQRVWEALEIANLKEVVEALPEKLNSGIGEGGMKISGGQRQRLGIARALYYNPEVLIFDEATSSLDNESEKVITEAITKLGHTKTMIIIAHRLNTLEKCDAIYEVKDKSIYKE